MKSIKLVVLSTFIVLGVFWAATYTSCTKDACKAVSCANGGTCGGGVCSCPNGIGGASCEIVYRQLYANVYEGSWKGDTGTFYNNTLNFTAGNDSNYNKMQLAWSNPGKQTVNFPVTLTNNSSTGSNFTLGSATIDTFTYTGTGSVNSTVASVTLTETHPVAPPVLISLVNFNRQ